MERENKFRGKRKDNGEWVYGDLIQYSELETKILEPFYRQWDILEGGYDVIPESVGQYTGLKDTNGIEIYEGDIMQSKEFGHTAEVVWNQITASFKLKFGVAFSHIADRNDYMGIVGNIFENPELLK